MGKPTVTKKFEEMAKIYKRFASPWPNCDFSEEAKLAQFLAESQGHKLPESSVPNGYALGKKVMDVTVAAWKEDMALGLLCAGELLDDGFEEDFLRRMGVWETRLDHDKIRRAFGIGEVA